MPSASNMAKLKWSDTLADIATEWSSSCVFPGHRGSGSSSCANALSSRSIDFSGYDSGDGCGENMYASGADPVWSVLFQGDDFGIRGGVEGGWCLDEAAAWTYGTTIGDAGHYTQCVWANSRYVGCGFAQCPNSDGWMKNLFTCNVCILY